MHSATLAKEHEGLLDIDDVEHFDPERDQPLFDEIKAVLVKHGADHRFGVTLLHKHFDLYDGEKLVETSDPVSRTLTIRPTTQRLSADQCYVETNWRFDTDSLFVNQRCFANCIVTGGRHHEVHNSR